MSVVCSCIIRPTNLDCSLPRKWESLSEVRDVISSTVTPTMCAAAAVLTDVTVAVSVFRY
jgi:hypothetical protein